MRALVRCRFGYVICNFQTSNLRIVIIAAAPGIGHCADEQQAKLLSRREQRLVLSILGDKRPVVRDGVRLLRFDGPGGERAERAEQQREDGQQKEEAGAPAEGAGPGAVPRRRSARGRKPAHRVTTRRARVRETCDGLEPRALSWAAGPPGRRAAGPPGRRAAGPPGRRAAGPPGRRAAGPPGRRAAGLNCTPENSRACQAHRRTSPRTEHRARRAPVRCRNPRRRPWKRSHRIRS